METRITKWLVLDQMGGVKWQSLDQGPPRLPDPPPQDSPFGYSPCAVGVNYSLQQTMNTQYLQDLVRALEFYIAQQQRSEIANNSQTINWFLS